MSESLLLSDFQPRSELVVPETMVPRPRYAAIDAHNHLPVGTPRLPASDVAGVVAVMNQVGVEAIVNLSGETGEVLKRRLEAMDSRYPGRFYTFCNADWEGVGTAGWTERAVRQLQADVRAGARGLKIYKQLGLTYRDPDGRLVPPDDARIGDLWDAAGALHIPVLIHSADPVAFFRPLDRHNERWDELQRHPDWHFFGGDYPPYEELIASLYRTIEAHPKTRFITAHVGCYPENLGFVSAMMERYPNMSTDFSARIGELGRAPYSAREWFLRFQDRIVFGTDSTPEVDLYQTYYRFLETRDEYFNYSHRAPVPHQGRWHIYGLGLPDDVLEKVYRLNVRALLGLS